MVRSSVRKRVRVVVATAALLAAGCGSGHGADESIGQQVSAITFPNDKPAYDYFVGKGLTAVQAAGIVGNLDQESGVDPTAVESGGPGRGIAQWSVGGRWDTDADDNAVWFASQQALGVETLTLQLDFVWYELSTYPAYGLAALKQTTSVTDATVAFETAFEGCGVCDESQRIAYAENVLAAFGPASDAAADAAFDAATCTVATTGAMGDCLDTAACAALEGYTSTPGYCPGPANVQCCTATSGAGDGGETHGGTSDGATGTTRDASSTSARDATADGTSTDDATAASDAGSDVAREGSGGCALNGEHPRHGSGGVGLAVAWAAASVLRRRRRSTGSTAPSHARVMVRR